MLNIIWFIRARNTVTPIVSKAYKPKIASIHYL